MSSKSVAQRSSPTKRTDNRQRPQPMQGQGLGSGSPNPAEMQKRLGNQGTQAWLAEQRIQPKLTIGQPGDQYEQEADRTADKVMRMPDPGSPGDEETKHQAKPQLSVLQRSSLSNTTENHPIQRLCTECEKVLSGQSEQKLQRKENNEQTPHVRQDIEANINALDGKGSPLPDSSRNYFEPRFGADFGQVRVHTDAHAAETAKSINAKVFTVGNNIAFGSGQFAPDSHQGQKLMGHELTHVVQQGNGSDLSMLANSNVAIINRDEAETSTAEDPLDEIREILSNWWVGPLDEYRLEAIWNSFGARVFEVASANIDLWNLCLDHGAELYDIDAVDAAKEAFRSDTRQIARNYLDLNEHYILAEMEAVGLAEDMCLIPTEEQEERLAEIQEIATEVISAQQAQSELRSIEVGQYSEYIPQIDSMVEVPAYFDPERQPDLPSSNPRISWSVAKEHYDNLSRVISGFANRYPAIYAVMQQGSDEAMATLAAGSPQEARIVISGAFGETLANIRATRPKIGDDLDDRDLTPIHDQLFSGPLHGPSGIDWSNSLYKGAAEEMLADHERVEFWISLGLGTLAAAAFVVVELATAGSATFFIAAGVGLGSSGLLVGRSWEQYEDLATAADTEVSEDMQLVTQGQASAAFVTALVDSAFAFIDIAGPVARIARGGAATGRAVAREGGEAVSEVAGREGAEALPEAEGRASAEAGEAGTEAAVRAGTREAGEAGAEAATTAAARLRPEDAANWSDVQRFIGTRVDSSNVPSGYSVFNRGGKTFIRRNIGDDARFARLTVDENGLIQAGRSVSRRISRPGALAANLGSRPARHQAHHVVPDQVVRDHPLFEAARRRGRPPYNVDNAGNGAYLAETPADRIAGISDNLPTHVGSHPQYNALATRQGDSVMNRLIQRYGRLEDVPPEMLMSAANEVQQRMREQLGNWVGVYGDALR